MRVLIRVWLVTPVLAFGLLPSVYRGVAGQSEHGFTGTWLRNPDESDDPHQKIRAAAEEIFNKATKGGRDILTEDIQQIQGRLQRSLASFLQFAERLTLDEDGKELHVDDGGRVRIFYVDGKKHVRQSPDSTEWETLCTRHGNQIIVEQKTEGAKIVETYTLSQEGGRLLLDVQMEVKRLEEPLTLRNVYERDL